MAAALVPAVPAQGAVIAAPEGAIERDSLEARQYQHLASVDECYLEAYGSMRQAVGESAGTPSLLTASYAPYMAVRQELLKQSLLEQHEQCSATGQYSKRHRMMLGECGALTDSVSACSPADAFPSQPGVKCSYMAWRRALLGLRLEKRRLALEDEMIRRLANEAMQRALAAEAVEREQTEAAEAGVSLAAEPLVWRIRHQFEGVSGVAGSIGSRPQPPTRGRQLSEGSRRGAAAFGLPAGVLGAGITALAFANEAPDIFAVGTESGTVYLCSAELGVAWARLDAHGGAVTGLEWSSGYRETMLATCSADKTARLWRVAFPSKRQPPPMPPPRSKPTRRGADGAPGAVATGAGAGAKGAASRSVPPPQRDARSLAGSAASGAGGSGAGGSGRRAPLSPEQKAEELARLRRELAEDAERERIIAEHRRGVVLVGGGATVLKTLATDYTLTHVAFWPGCPGYLVCAGFEEGDEAEGGVGEGLEGEEVGEDGRTRGVMSTLLSPAAAGRAGVAGVKAMGSLLTKGVKGGVKAMKAVGGATMGAIEAVPVVGGAVGGAVGMTVSVMKGATNLTVGVASRAVAGALGVKQRRERVGHVVVLHAGLDRLVQDRRVEGKRTADLLSKIPSYATAMAFHPGGGMLFVADARGLLHAYAMETDPARQQIKPLSHHAVIFGEGASVFSPIGAAAGGGGAAAGGSGGGGGGGSRRRLDFGGGGSGGAGFGSSSAVHGAHSSSGGGGFASGFGSGFGSSASSSAAAASGGPTGGDDGGAEGSGVFLTSLRFRPQDLSLHGPLLVGLDSSNHVRALRLSQPAAVAGEGMGNWAVGMAAAWAPQVHEVAYLMYTAGVAPGIAAALERRRSSVNDSVGSDSSSLGRNTLGRLGALPTLHVKLKGESAGPAASVPAWASMFSSSSSSTAAAAGGGFDAGGAGGDGKGGSALSLQRLTSRQQPQLGQHCSVALAASSDGVLVGSASGEMYILNPHGQEAAAAASVSGRALTDLGGLLRGGNPAVAGSGVLSSQVVAKLFGHVHPVTQVALSRYEDWLVSADETGQLLSWQKVPLSVALADGGPEGYVYEEALARSAMPASAAVPQLRGATVGGLAARGGRAGPAGRDAAAALEDGAGAAAAERLARLQRALGLITAERPNAGVPGRPTVAGGGHASGGSADWSASPAVGVASPRGAANPFALGGASAGIRQAGMASPGPAPGGPASRPAAVAAASARTNVPAAAPAPLAAPAPTGRPPLPSVGRR
jgi:hypothetical protein